MKAMKEQALEHYDRMIKYAIKRYKKDPTEKVSPKKMREAIGEDYSGDYCIYCETFTCSSCPLGTDEGCCGSHYHAMEKSTNWLQFSAHAERVRDYINRKG